jgi:ribosomal protein S18 acetylase RimI-like enzyme
VEKGIRIEVISPQNLGDVERCDRVFTIDGRVELAIEEVRLKYTVREAIPDEKTYPLEEVDYAAYIGNPDKIVWLATVEGQIAGQLRLARHWNRFANIEDLVVDRQFRRRGVGRALIERAKVWAREKQLAGLSVETQTNNLPAIRLYEACGFELGGYDRLLYQGLQPGTEEAALYWYLIF